MNRPPLRRTKIVATLGPSSGSPEVIGSLIEAGVDVVRINFSHGEPEKHLALAELVRSLARAANAVVGVMVDLQGPKIRIGRFENDSIELAAGDRFIFDADCPLGNQERVGLDYKALTRDVFAGDTLLLDDGKMVMHVENVKGNEIFCTVVHGGTLAGKKGINRKGGGLTAPALTERDKEHILWAAKMEADFLAVSFPRSGDDMKLARALIHAAGHKSFMIAKIERPEAVRALDEMLDASDGVMVARGDLAVEMGDAVVPALQKRIIRRALAKGRVVITATQMMESMIQSPVPTRAEVSDVANAVLDGTDAVMLSAETASGQYPVEAVSAMARVCLEAEKEALDPEYRSREPAVAAQLEEAIARAAIHTAEILPVKAIASLTQSGTTARLMSRRDTRVPVYALSPQADTRRKVTLFRGVYPIRFGGVPNNWGATVALVEQELIKRRVVHHDDLVLITWGEPFGKAGGTNTMKIVKIGEARKG